MYQEITTETKNRARKMCTVDRMLPPHNLFYYYSILYSAECAVRAFEAYEYALNKGNSDPLTLVSLVQEAIGHAGSLSFYFWNNGNSSRKPKEIKEYIEHRSSCFKKEFNLDDSSPLQDRSIRNTFEHFDEKVDIFLINNLSGTFYPMPKVGSHTEIEEKQLNKNFKLLDIKKKCLVLLDKKFFFEDIQKEVYKIYTISKEKARVLG